MYNYSHFITMWLLSFTICGAATSENTVTLPIFGDIELQYHDDDTWHGTSQAITHGPVQIDPAHVVLNDDEVTITANARIRNGHYTLQVTRGRDVQDLTDAHTVYTGTIWSTDGTEPKICGVTFENPTVWINGKTNIFEICGDTQLLGLHIRMDITAHLRSESSLRVSAECTNISTTWKPFEGSSLPQRLQDITVHDIAIGFKAGVSASPEQRYEILGSHYLRTSDTHMADVDQIMQSYDTLFGALSIHGTCEIMHVPTEIYGEIGISNGEPGVAFVAHMPEGWHITDSFPQLDNSKLSEVLKHLAFHDTRCVLTSYATYAIHDSIYSRGITIESRVGWDANTDNAILQHISRICAHHGDHGPYLFMKGAWDGEGPEGLYLKTGVSSGAFGFNLGPAAFYNGSIYTELSGAPSFGIAGSCNMKPSPDEDPLAWYIGISATPDDIALSGSMRGTWHNPFGSRGVSIRNLALKGGQTYTAIAEAAASSGIAALIPSQAGISGEGDIQLPDGTFTTFDVKANIGKRITTLALLAYLRSSISFDSLITCLLYQAHLPYNNIHIPQLQLEQTHLQFVPLGTYIGQVRVDQGIGASCYCNIFGHRVYIDIGISISEGGVHLFGQLPTLHFGPVHITGSHGYDAPTINSVVNVHQQHVVIDGRINIGNIFITDNYTYLGHNGLHFDFEHKLGPIRLAINGHTHYTGQRPRDFDLTIAFTNDTINRLHRIINRITRDIAMPDIDDLSDTELADMMQYIDNEPGREPDTPRSIFHINSIYFHGTAREVAHGKAPHMHVDMHIAGKQRTIDVQFNFLHPNRSIKHIVREISRAIFKGYVHGT